MSAPVFLSKPGVICSAGSGIDDVWQASLAGNNGGLAPFTLCTGESFFAGRIADSALKPTADRFDMRSLSIEEAALEQIAADVHAAIGAYGAENVGVCVGSCDNGSEQAIAAHKTQAETGSFPPEYDLCAQSASYPAEFVRRKFGTGSVCLGFATACASSASGISKYSFLWAAQAAFTSRSGSAHPKSQKSSPPPTKATAGCHTLHPAWRPNQCPVVSRTESPRGWLKPYPRPEYRRA